MLCSYGNQVESSLSSFGHMCMTMKGRTEEFVKVR